VPRSNLPETLQITVSFDAGPLGGNLREARKVKVVR
jgi:hypothetical protein